MQVKGVRGVVKVGPHVAASLISWSLETVAPETYEFTARLGTVDRFWITQAPHDLRLTLGASTWICRGVLLNVAGDHASACVPRPERI
jgi:hypothetical protein